MGKSHAEARLLDYWTRAGYSPATVKQRLGCLRQLQVENYRDATPADVIACLPDAVSPATRRVYVAAIRASFRDLITLGLADRNPADGLRTPGFHRGTPRPLPRAVLEQLLDAEPCRQRDWTVLGAFAGLRSAEVAGLYLEDLVPHGDSQGIRVVGKGLREAVIPAHPRVLEVFDAHAGRRGPLWRLQPGTLSSLWAGWCAGITGEVYRFHQLRHRFATDVYRASGADLITTRDLLRHASVVTTQVYAGVEADRALRAVAGL